MRYTIRYHGFTLIEVTLTMIIIWLIIPSVFAIYTFLIKSNKEIIARERTVQQWYEFFERLNLLMQDYTVDYEEYYNRQMVGCVKSGSTAPAWANFKWNIWVPWYCTEFTAYWNRNKNLTQTDWHDIYYCSTEKSVTAGQWTTKVVFQNTRNGDWNCGRQEGYQSYGQYMALFKDVKGGTWIIVWSDDDEELWNIFNPNVDAISDWDHVQELYLISHDWKKRLYFRRKNVAAAGEDPHYKIQILRLRWFDAWRMHNFDNNNKSNVWRYDGIIDTRACDASMWFEWHWSSVWWAYSSYHLPQNVNDCWIDLTYGVSNILSWNITISPLWDPDLYRANPNRQINTYMKILTANGIYGPALFYKSSLSSSVREYKIPIETTINMKDFYRWYSQ
jgi:hypothetical protein